MEVSTQVWICRQRRDFDDSFCKGVSMMWWKHQEYCKDTGITMATSQLWHDFVTIFSSTLVILCKNLNLRNTVFITVEVQGESDVADMGIRGVQRKYEKFAEVTVNFWYGSFNPSMNMSATDEFWWIVLRGSVNGAVEASRTLQRHGNYDVDTSTLTRFCETIQIVHW